ncbi:alpha/beta hydrolase family protein [Neptunitalea lumnitzerae]|uniref:Serine aminopeptidase S33 domain-containing protein n=1 Tax=Neptunitalea lumnitzerae TaxID=2965509 RepID=A0ABQ5MIJ9_9FLAO|nr:alpha/beta hydrolase [Neptunitalea sp. Y10]GLB49218.1 hypothetical protein Y10_15860 [Neptunitalea sp. Y10]
MLLHTTLLKKIIKGTLSITIILLFITTQQLTAQANNTIKTEEVVFSSNGIKLSGTLYTPRQPHAALVVVHGSGQELRMGTFAELLASNGILVLTYDKRGVGASEGIYAGPEVGTNNIDSLNLNLLADDASAAVNTLKKKHKNIPVGLIGFSQAGWVMPLAATKNKSVTYMVLFSCPTITTLEQLRFQFYTNGNPNFWEQHTEAEAREHLKNDPDRYEFAPTDPKASLRNLEIPALYLFGEKDIQIPVKVCLEQINDLKAKGKPFEYTLFPTLGHNTAFANTTLPVTIALSWIAEKMNLDD